MDSNPPRQRDPVEFPMAPIDGSALIEVRSENDNRARSEDNVLQWMSYLPEECVKTMIAMGWDVTT